MVNPWPEADAVPLAATSSAFCEQAQIGGGCSPPKAASFYGGFVQDL
jgi:hypothetical protein